MMETKRPIQGIWFRINPERIDQTIFETPRQDWDHEWTRKKILEAFHEWRTKWKKYGIAFDIMIPKKTWELATSFEEISQFAYELGGYQAEWVHFMLLLAYRIQEEGWDAVCDKPDTDWYHKLVLWKDGKFRMVGGSVDGDDDSPLCSVWPAEGGDKWYKLSTTVPLLVR